MLRLALTVPLRLTQQIKSELQNNAGFVKKQFVREFSRDSRPGVTRSRLQQGQTLKEKLTAATKSDVMTSRVNQIDEGTSHAAQLHLLQIEHAKQVLLLDEQLLLNAKDANAHAREKHLLELEQMKEYHKKRMREF